MGGRQALAALLTVLLAFPAWTTSRVAGMAASSELATVRGKPLTAGTTIFSGDTIDVAAKGNARIALSGSAQLYVAGESQVRVSKTKETVAMEVLRGRAWFRSAKEAPVEGRLADATVRSADGAPAVGVVAIVDAKSALIAAEKGRLLVTTAHDAKSVTLREGEAVEVTLAPAPQAAGTAATTLSLKYVALLGAVVIATATVLGLILTREADKLTDKEKKDQVSPFRFP